MHKNLQKVNKFNYFVKNSKRHF